MKSKALVIGSPFSPATSGPHVEHVPVTGFSPDISCWKAWIETKCALGLWNPDIRTKVELRSRGRVRPPLDWKKKIFLKLMSPVSFYFYFFFLFYILQNMTKVARSIFFLFTFLNMTTRTFKITYSSYLWLTLYFYWTTLVLYRIIQRNPLLFQGDWKFFKNVFCLLILVNKVMQIIANIVEFTSINVSVILHHQTLF